MHPKKHKKLILLTDINTHKKKTSRFINIEWWKIILRWKNQKTSELQNVSGGYSGMRCGSHLRTWAHSPPKTSCHSWYQASSSKMHTGSYIYLWSEKETFYWWKKEKELYIWYHISHIWNTILHINIITTMPKTYNTKSMLINEYRCSVEEPKLLQQCYTLSIPLPQSCENYVLSNEII